MVIINNNNNIKESLLPLLPGGSSIILSSPSLSLSRGSSSKNSISALDKLGNLVVVYTPSSGGAASFGTSGAGSAIIATVSITAAELVPSSAPIAATAPTAGSSNVEVF